jgi:uncharacterized protein YbaR (Trm112 family)
MIAADTSMACQRTGGTGGWSNFVYRTERWTDLAERADHDDPQAWREIKELVDRAIPHDHATCTGRHLRAVEQHLTRLEAKEVVVPAGFAPDLLDILVCPENGSGVRLATRAEIRSINGRIRAHTLFYWNGDAVNATVTAVLIRADQRIAYAVNDGIPDMRIDHALVLDPAVGPPDPDLHRPGASK